MIKKLTILFLLVFLSACSFVFDSVKTYETNKDPTYNVAILLPLTGKYKKIGESLLNTIHLAYAQNTNKYIVLKIYDTKSDPSNTEYIAQKILADNNKAVIGPLFGEEAVKVARILEKQDIPVFTFSNDVTLINNVSNLYTLSPLPVAEMEASIDYASKNLESKSFAVLVPNNKYGEAMQASINKSLKDRDLTLVRYITYPTDTSRLMPYIKKLLPKDELAKYNKVSQKLANEEEILDEDGNKIIKIPDANLDFDTLIIADFGSRVSVVASHLPYLGVNIHSLKIIGISNWETPEIYKNNFLQNSYFASLNNFYDTSFAKKYQKYYDKLPSLLDITAYDSVITVMSLVYKDTEGNLVNNFTNTNITSIKLTGLAGDFIIAEDHTSRRNLTIKQINKNKDGIAIIKENLSISSFVKNYNYKNLQIKVLKY